MYATSLGDGSSDNKTTSVSELAARVLQSHFDCGGDNPWRPGPGDDVSLRQPVLRLSLVLFLAG